MRLSKLLCVFRVSAGRCYVKPFNQERKMMVGREKGKRAKERVSDGRLQGLERMDCAALFVSVFLSFISVFDCPRPLYPDSDTALGG